jgi:hypothetical protein
MVKDSHFRYFWNGQRLQGFRGEMYNCSSENMPCSVGLWTSTLYVVTRPKLQRKMLALCAR